MDDIRKSQDAVCFPSAGFTENNIMMIPLLPKAFRCAVLELQICTLATLFHELLKWKEFLSVFYYLFSCFTTCSFPVFRGKGNIVQVKSACQGALKSHFSLFYTCFNLHKILRDYILSLEAGRTQ